MKVIKDAIHGDIALTESDLSIIDSPEFQRLRNIKQLGLTDLVYPSSTHTRFQHSIGAFFITEKLADSLGFKKQDINELKASALLHDIGHLPFSHSLEKVLINSDFTDHMDISRKIILNNLKKVLEDSGVDPKKVADNIAGKGRFGKIFSSGADVDKMDYLLRDSYFTGVAYGICDLSRLISMSVFSEGEFAFNIKGLRTVESLILSRFMMYSAVYDHPVKRSAERMLFVALDSMDKRSLNIKKLIEGDEIDFMSTIREQGGITKDLISRIDSRRLFKMACSISRNDVTPEQLEKCFVVEDNPRLARKIEKELSEALKIPDGYLLIDILRRPKGLERIKIWNDGKLLNLSDVSLFSKSLVELSWQDWRVAFYCPKEYKDKVDLKVKDLFLAQLGEIKGSQTI